MRKVTMAMANKHAQNNFLATQASHFCAFICFRVLLNPLGAVPVYIMLSSPDFVPCIDLTTLGAE